MTELWAWIVTEADGAEGVAAAEMNINGQRFMMPLIGADIIRVNALEPYAKLVEKKTGMPITLKHFIQA